MFDFQQIYFWLNGLLVVIFIAYIIERNVAAFRMRPRIAKEDILVTMNALPLPLPSLTHAKRPRKLRGIIAVAAGLNGSVAGGVLGYGYSSAWAAKATNGDPDWDGGMAVLVVYAIIAVATVIAAIAGAIIAVSSAYLSVYLARRRALNDNIRNA